MKTFLNLSILSGLLIIQGCANKPAEKTASPYVARYEALVSRRPASRMPASNPQAGETPSQRIVRKMRAERELEELRERFPERYSERINRLNDAQQTWIETFKRNNPDQIRRWERVFEERAQAVVSAGPNFRNRVDGYIERQMLIRLSRRWDQEGYPAYLDNQNRPPTPGVAQRRLRNRQIKGNEQRRRDLMDRNEFITTFNEGDDREIFESDDYITASMEPENIALNAKVEAAKLIRHGRLERILAENKEPNDFDWIFMMEEGRIDLIRGFVRKGMLPKMKQNALGFAAETRRQLNQVIQDILVTDVDAALQELNSGRSGQSQNSAATVRRMCEVKNTSKQRADEISAELKRAIDAKDVQRHGSLSAEWARLMNSSSRAAKSPFQCWGHL